MKETFGQRLQRLRLAAGISQPRLATDADLPIGTLRNLEQDRRVPRLDTAAALARALNVGLDELTGDAFQPDAAPSPSVKGGASSKPTAGQGEGKRKKGRGKTT